MRRWQSNSTFSPTPLPFPTPPTCQLIARARPEPDQRKRVEELRAARSADFSFLTAEPPDVNGTPTTDGTGTFVRPAAPPRTRARPGKWSVRYALVEKIGDGGRRAVGRAKE